MAMKSSYQLKGSLIRPNIKTGFWLYIFALVAFPGVFAFRALFVSSSCTGHTSWTAQVEKSKLRSKRMRPEARR
jgi:hypothetical protein